MSSSVALQPEPAPVTACTVSRDVQAFDLLIEDMETELGESWGDLSFEDAIAFLEQPDSNALEFFAIAMDAQDEGELILIGELIALSKERGVKVILIAEDVSPTVLHQLLKTGANDFLPYPLPEGALHEAIERLRAPEPAAPILPETGQVPPVHGSRGKHDGAILAVHGLAGGVGATTFAVNLAWELAIKDKKDGPRVCLLDLDFQTGSTSTYLDLPRREVVYELLSDTSSMDNDSFLQALQTFNDKLHVLTAPADMLPLDIVGPDDITTLLNTARANFDVVVVDMPKTLVAWTETVLSNAHVYFSVLELDMRSAQNALRFVRLLKSEDLPYEKLRFALNRAPRFTDLQGKARVKRMAESLDIDIELMLPDGQRQVTQACDHGLPLSETAGKNPLRKEIAKLAASLHDLIATEVEDG
ncbi:AAA family ATPase [Tropicimonas sediminicola]|uniref:Pilus assembly protein CpaE n=1 Tax=Tropicimonas sediminicola TaxID=1031541 RepID=A0A239KL17_9RHOB|nr:AAA family ATPase [Tropicimonas sediminicola]SNT18289.1 pilus assembly protein CpaE [Tropicimonas sediminicola]